MARRYRLFHPSTIRLWLLLGIAHLAITLLAFMSAFSLAVQQHAADTAAALGEVLLDRLVGVLIAPIGAVFGVVPDLGEGLLSYAWVLLNSAAWAMAGCFLVRLVGARVRPKSVSAC